MNRLVLVGATLIATLSPRSAAAHDFAPGRLLVEETSAGFVAILAVPRAAPRSEGVALVPPANCTATAPTKHVDDDVLVVRRTFECSSPVATIEIAGLLASRLEVYVEIIRPDGALQSGFVRPEAPSLEVPPPRSLGARLFEAFAAGAHQLLGLPLLLALAIGLFASTRGRRGAAIALPIAVLVGTIVTIPAAVGHLLLALGALTVAARTRAVGGAAAIAVVFPLGALLTAEATVDATLASAVGWWGAWLLALGLATFAARALRTVAFARPLIGVVAVIQGLVAARSV